MRSVSYNKAIFLDRDGILNDLVLNPKTSQYEAPHKLNEVKILTNSFNFLKKLQEAEFYLFIISNQPDYALAKANLAEIKQIAAFVKSELEKNSIDIKKDYYCYHHPNGRRIC